VTRLSMPRSEKQRITPLSVLEVQDLGAEPWSSPNRASVCESPSNWRSAYRMSTFSGVRCGSNSRQPRTASTEYRPRHQDHDARCRYRKWWALAAHIAEFPPTEDGSLFTTANGNLYRHEHYGARIFAPSVKKAGLPAGTASHALRHHYASVLLAAGESVVAVAERLGHENAALVLKTYGHLMPDSEDRSRRAIDDVWTSDGTQTESDPRLEGIEPCQKPVS